MTRARDLANLIGSGNYTSTTFTATAGQTVFTIAHTPNFIQVFMNGLLLDETTDYTSNGTAVTLTSAATAGDELEVVKYNTFSVGDAITQTAADSRYVNTTGDTMTGGLNVLANVGIGTSSPSDALSVFTSADNGNNSSYTQAEISLGNGAYPVTIGSYRYGGSYLNGIDFYYNNGTPQLGMRIDSAGRVTMPYQPHGAWIQTLSATPTVSILRNNGPVSSASISSPGQNGYWGRFTAPVSGLYHFNVTTMEITRSTSNLLVNIYINGGSGGTYTTNPVPSTGEIIDLRYSDNEQDGYCYSHSIYLSANDYVEFGVYKYATGYTDTGWIICSGYLIG